MTKHALSFLLSALALSAGLSIGCLSGGSAAPEGPVTETARLTPTASDAARNMAVRCDGGSAEACCMLAAMWASGTEGLARNRGHHDRLQDRVAEEYHTNCMSQ